MSKSNYVIGLRAIEQLITNKNSEIKIIFAEYQSENKRLQSIIKSANTMGIVVNQQIDQGWVKFAGIPCIKGSLLK